MTGPITGGRNPWIVGKALPGTPDVRLYCFPHSGGLASEYVRWGRELPGVQVYGVCPPGRGGRITEPPLTQMSALVDALVDRTDFTAPFVFFGHSLGALVAFEVARELRARGRRAPDRIILSAYAAPQLPRNAAQLHALPDAELTAAIGERYGALPEHVVADPALMALLLPAFRTDFQVLETYRHREGPPLSTPLEVFGADRDAVPFEALERWGEHTTASCRVHRFAGGHFYFRDDPAAMYAALRGVLDPPETAETPETPG